LLYRSNRIGPRSDIAIGVVDTCRESRSRCPYPYPIPFPHPLAG
jgi:hypothetical protein